MIAGVDGIVISGVSRRRPARQAGGGGVKPQRAHHPGYRGHENVVVDRYVLHRILEKDLRGDVVAEIAIEGVVVNSATRDPAAQLAPEMDAVVVIAVQW